MFVHTEEQPGLLFRKIQFSSCIIFPGQFKLVCMKHAQKVRESLIVYREIA